ncbi:hypothetical protein Ferp_0519 [Ferroglobus placidus DSM 10642]|uniref:Uncharacterized protein n=1 Tax=Ferroglobus placidus (strain DSM 10642 / AEDII12DO) TaxID=589924 RepID=D3S360_FERPA|nr:hypothetical protein [Ferroglobus placidus]ADC64693.1 hypothetical protein Ferp_0519 [Ferroglobus placidus DSM 10642]
MSLFDQIVEINRKMFAEGNSHPAHVILVRDDEPLGLIVLPFIDSFIKQLIFGVVIPQIVRAHAPEACIFVLPSTMKEFVHDRVEVEDVVMVQEVDAIKIRTVIIKKGEIVEPEEENVQANLLEPVREAMKSVWEEII